MSSLPVDHKQGAPIAVYGAMAAADLVVSLDCLMCVNVQTASMIAPIN